MIVWISGAYGVGKSTLARALAKKMENARLFDAELVGDAVRGNYPDDPYGYIFEDYPLWGRFCQALLRDIHENFGGNILVPMTLLRAHSYGDIIQPLLDARIDTRLLILEASHASIHDRILSRGEEEGCWCMENIGFSSQGASELPGVHIDTEGKSVEQITGEVMALLRK